MMGKEEWQYWQRLYMLPKDFVEKNRLKAYGSMFYGVPLADMSKLELMCAVSVMQRIFEYERSRRTT